MCYEFDWKHFLYLADVLIGHGAMAPVPAAKERTSISRAYYAAYNLAVSYIRENDPAFLRSMGARITHGDISQWFKDRDEKSLKRVGTTLERLCQKRHDADYINRMGDPGDDAVVSSNWAWEVVQALE
jgi:hypothetical protein